MLGDSRPRRRTLDAVLFVVMALALALGMSASAEAAIFNPAADSHVDATTASTNYGTKTSLKVDNSPVVTSYLRFDVQGVGTASAATLSVFAETSNSVGFQVRTVSDNTWSETGLTYNNAPALGPVIASAGPVQGGNWYSADVSSAVAGDGLVSLALTTTSGTATRYASREGANKPLLEALGGGSPPPPPPPPPPSGTDYLVTREGSSYRAAPAGAGGTYTGTLKSAVERAVWDLNGRGGGAITFTAGTFDFGSDRFDLTDIVNVTFQGQGQDVTVLQNNSSASTDTEPFDMSRSSRLVIRDMTLHAGGPFRSTSDVIDFDGGADNLIERIKITGSRGRGIVFDGKDLDGSVPRNAMRNVIRDCVITGIPSDGIEFLAATDNRVEGCTITDVAGHGIQATKASSSAGQRHKKPNGNILTGNTIVNSGMDGVNVNSGDHIQIIGNTIRNSSNVSSGRDGIRISGSDSIACDDNLVSGNTATDDQSTKTQAYGLRIGSLCHRTVVTGNNFAGNRSGPISDQGAGTIYS